MWERFKALSKFFFLLSWSYYLSDFRSGSITRNKLETAVGWTFQSSNLTFQNALLKFNCASLGCGPKTGFVQLSLCPHTQPVSVGMPQPEGFLRTPLSLVCQLLLSYLPCCSLTQGRGSCGSAVVVRGTFLLPHFLFRKAILNVTEPLLAAVSISVGQEIDFIFPSFLVWVKNGLFFN